MENARFPERISHIARTVLAPNKDECMNVEQFREYGRWAFRFLIEQYGFREAPLPEGKFVNDYMICFSSGVAWVGVLRSPGSLAPPSNVPILCGNWYKISPATRGRCNRRDA